MPSIPTLNIPARWTMVSPIAAMNIGAASLTAEAQKKTVNSSSIASRPVAAPEPSPLLWPAPGWEALP